MKKRFFTKAMMAIALSSGAMAQEPQSVLDGQQPSLKRDPYVEVCQKRLRLSDLINTHGEADVDVLFLDRSRPEGAFASALDPDAVASVRVGYKTGLWEFAYMGTQDWESSATLFGQNVHLDTQLFSVEANRSLFSLPWSQGCLHVGAGLRYIGLAETVSLDNVPLGRDSDNNLIGAQYVLDYERAVTEDITFGIRNASGLYANFASTDTRLGGTTIGDKANLAAFGTDLKVGFDTHLGRGWSAETAYQISYLANVHNATDVTPASLLGPVREDDFFAHGLVLGVSKRW